jgi:hypothetical protein
MAKKEKTYDDKGKEICGAKTKSRKKKDGSVRSNTKCHRAPMPNGRCALHGGKSTGPKNSIAYYRKTLLGENQDSLDIENPMDLIGELGLVRSLLTRMMDDPLKAYCQDCRQWVYVNIECPNKEYNNESRLADGKRALEHYVKVRDNDHSAVVKATKLLSDVAKNHKEIQRGKEVVIRIEILNLVISKVVEAYETANRLENPDDRRRVFVEAVDRLRVDTTQGEVAQRVQKTSER